MGTLVGGARETWAELRRIRINFNKSSDIQFFSAQCSLPIQVAVIISFLLCSECIRQ